MATPRHIHIFPECGLEIEVDESSSTFRGLDFTNSKRPWKYKVTNYDQICPSRCATAEREEDIGGWLSPIARITLPPTLKANAGIPDKATSYAFMYPPQGLAEILFKQIDLDIEDSFYVNPEISQPIIIKQAIQSAAILGGFAYFDKNCECICINAFSTQISKHKLKFSGPYEVNQSVCDELFALCRPHPLQIDIFHEVGFVSYAWVRPREMFQSKSVFVAEGSMNHDGTMVFFRENGTGVAYAVNPSDYVDPTGYVGILSEPVQRTFEAKLTKKIIQPIDEVNAWGDQVKHWKNSVPTAKLVEKFKDKRRAIHMACHAGLGHEFISYVLSNVEEKHNISYQDSFGWNPLHYACCFSPSDYVLIKLLVTECPEAAVQFDVYDRSPLHIACNSDTSERVIAVLLEADTSIPKVTLTKKTRRFGLLPLHLACFNGAKYDIINALLEADYDGKTTIQKSRAGQLPLHLAILKKLPTSSVKALLDVDSKLRKSDRSEFDSETLNFDDDIYQSFDGKLPLHLACYNNSSSEIIELLLKKDEQNTTINETVKEVPPSVDWGDEQHFFLDDVLSVEYMPDRSLCSGRTHDMSIISSPLIGEAGEKIDGVLAFHLAMIHGSKGVISLLLRKEMDKAKKKFGACTLHKRDGLGKTPLHIACQYNVGPQIIQDMLDLDPLNKSTQIRDNQGFMPIHYACENKGTTAETINILLDAEEQYLEEELTNGRSIRRSTHTGDTERKRTPLYLAVKSGVEAEVFVRLLQPEHFLLKDFDDHTIGDLAEIVKSNRAIQAQVIGRMSERIYFCFLILELYACVGALISFSVGSGKYISGDITLAEPSILIASTAVLIVREALQILSVGTDYIGDLYSWFEITNIVLQLITFNIFREAAIDDSLRPDKSSRYLLAITGFTIVFQLIVYLKATFHQFARFAGGVLLIMRLLIPFLSVSVLMIWAFLHAISITSDGALGKNFTRTFRNTFDFAPDNLNFFEILFAILIIIVLFNVVIAIVDEAWKSAAQKSNGLFWQYRLEKIFELRYLLKMRERSAAPFSKSMCGYAILLNKIDSVRNIAYGGDVSWTKAPYHIMKKQDHYINPHKYFGPDQVKLILDAHSLRADLYWAGIDDDLTPCEKFVIMLKWLVFLTLYGVLIVLGIPTLGILWPEKFRRSLLTLGFPDQENID